MYLLESQGGVSHPLAQAICTYAETHYPVSSLLKSVVDLKHDEKGRGLCARVNGQLIHVGNKDYLRDCGIDCPDESGGETLVYVAEDTIYKGIIAIAHETTPTNCRAITSLKATGQKAYFING